jgi:hypothetical protein
MDENISPGLKYTFLVHGVMMAIFALTYLLIPVLWGDLTGCLSNQVPQVFRIFGTSILGLSIASMLAYRENTWRGVKVVAQMERLLNILFPIVILIALLFWDLPKIGWLYFVVTGGFGIAFNVTYPRR